MIGLADDVHEHHAPARDREHARRGSRATRAVYARPRARADKNSRQGFRPRRAASRLGLRAAKSGTRLRKIARCTAKTRWRHLPVQEGPFPHESPSADRPVPGEAPNWGPADWPDVLKKAPVFSSERGAAYSFLDRNLGRSIAMDREIYTLIVDRGGGRYSPLPAQIGTRHSSTGFKDYLQSFKDARIRGARVSSWAHTHGADTPGVDDEIFSTHPGGDTDTAAFYNLKGYLGTPRGRFLELLPRQTVGTDLGALPPLPR